MDDLQCGTVKSFLFHGYYFSYFIGRLNHKNQMSNKCYIKILVIIVHDEIHKCFMSKKMSFLRKPQNVMPVIRNDFAVFRNFIESLLIKLAMRLLGLIKYKLTGTC